MFLENMMWKNSCLYPQIIKTDAFISFIHVQMPAVYSEIYFRSCEQLLTAAAINVVIILTADARQLTLSSCKLLQLTAAPSCRC